MNDIVWAINPANDDVEKIIQRMESFAKPLMAAKEIQLQTTCTDAAKKAHLSMEKRKNFYLIFKEAINNVVKYAACSQCKILVDIKGNKMILMVEDNGIGFNIQNSNNLQEAFSISGTGNGLKNMQQRAKEMKGSLQIISSEGAGTTIHLQFPIP
jgi:signal transduction histidine kinase